MDLEGRVEAIEQQIPNEYFMSQFSAEEIELFLMTGGKGILRVLGLYTTRYELEAEVPTPSIGDHYYVGSAAPYDLYLYTQKGWINTGPLVVVMAAGEK